MATRTQRVGSGGSGSDPARSSAAAASAASSVSQVSACAAVPSVPCASDSSSPRLQSLVLGMAYVSESYGSRASPGTTIAVCRDRARLMLLEQAGYDIISLNHSHTAEQCRPKRHLYARFDRRTVDELIDTFGVAGQMTLDRIYCDYFRFPGDYMRAAYGEFLRSMLPALISRGVMGARTVLVMPNLDRLLTADLQGKRFTRPSDEQPAIRTQACYLQFSALPAADYPLYAVTEHVDAEVLGGFRNDREIEQLHGMAPFVNITLTDCPRTSQQSYALTFAQSHNGSSTVRPQSAAKRKSTAASSPPTTSSPTTIAAPPAVTAPPSPAIIPPPVAASAPTVVVAAPPAVPASRSPTVAAAVPTPHVAKVAEAVEVAPCAARTKRKSSALATDSASPTDMCAAIEVESGKVAGSGDSKHRAASSHHADHAAHTASAAAASVAASSAAVKPSPAFSLNISPCSVPAALHHRHSHSTPPGSKRLQCAPPPPPLCEGVQLDSRSSSVSPLSPSDVADVPMSSLSTLPSPPPLITAPTQEVQMNKRQRRRPREA